jgi:4-amino-4-deoxy-L-arabinose transferase-like glycosyltransferase
MTLLLAWRSAAFLLSLAILGSLAVLLATSRFGVGLSPDSVNYVVTAKNILAGRGVKGFDDLPLVVQPPLYPATLAAFSSVFRTGPEAVARALNAALFATMVCLTAILIRAWGGTRALALVGAAVVFLSKPLFEVSLMAWSEPLFVFLTMLWLLSGARYITRGTWQWLTAFALFAAAASMTRYLGISLILTGIAAPYFVQRDRGARWRHVLLCASLSVLPLALWVTRNVLVSGSAMGVRDPSPTSVVTNLELSLSRLSSWYMPPGLAPPLVILLTASVGLFALLGAIRCWRGEWLKHLILPAAFSCVYVMLLIAASSTSTIDPIDNRLLAPTYVPVTLVTISMANTWFRVPRAAVMRALAVFVMGAWLLYATLAFSRVVRHHAQMGAGGYSTMAWRESPLVRYLRDQSQCTEKPLYSNSPEALYALLGVEAKSSPRHGRGCQPAFEPMACLVWFDSEKRPFLAPPEELQTCVDLHLERRLENGAVYAVSSVAR